MEWKLSKPYEGKLISLLTLWCFERKLIKTLWSEANPFIGLSTLPFIDFNIYFSTFPTCPPREEKRRLSILLQNKQFVRNCLNCQLAFSQSIVKVKGQPVYQIGKGEQWHLWHLITFLFSSFRNYVGTEINWAIKRYSDHIYGLKTDRGGSETVAKNSYFKFEQKLSLGRNRTEWPSNDLFNPGWN